MKVVVLEHAGDALAMYRGANSSVSEEATATTSGCSTHEADIGFEEMPRRRQGAAHRDDIVAIEPEPVGEHEPAFDPALFLAKAVMVMNAMDPFAPQLPIVQRLMRAASLRGTASW